MYNDLVISPCKISFRCNFLSDLSELDDLSFKCRVQNVLAINIDWKIYQKEEKREVSNLFKFILSFEMKKRLMLKNPLKCGSKIMVDSKRCTYAHKVQDTRKIALVNNCVQIIVSFIKWMS